MIRKIPSPGAAAVLLLLVVSIPSSAGFVPTDIKKNNFNIKTHHVSPVNSFPSSTLTHKVKASPSTLQMANPLSVVSKTISPLASAITSSPHAPLLKKIFIVLTSAYLLLSKQYKRILWPGSQTKDSAVSEPLPPTALGCPLFGQANLFGSTTKDGPMAGMKGIARKMGNIPIFRMYTFGTTITSVAGLDNVKTALKREFEDDGINTMLYGDNWVDIFGGESILYEGDKKKHAFLRRLVGSAMNPAAIAAAVPEIQAVANREIDDVLAKQGEVVKMEDVVTHYTLSIAHRQILGLDLKEGEEVEEFHRQVKAWMNSMADPVMFLPFRLPWLKWTKGFQAHDYLVGKVEEKLKRLDEEGPDDSTLSKMYFAVDDEGDEGADSSAPRKLTHQQVIDNAMILIIAGSETSSNTLTMASLLLGLYPDVFQKIKAEQTELRSKYGDDLSKDILDECKYLDAVVKETMRIAPIDTGELRRTKETLVVDGTQIPKNSMVMLNIRQSHTQDRVTFKEDGSHMDLKVGFDPDRWLNAETKPSVFMGFGEGGRRCLGERLAMTEMKIFLATMARRFDYDLVRSKDDDILYSKKAFMDRPSDGSEIIPRAVTAAAKVGA